MIFFILGICCTWTRLILKSDCLFLSEFCIALKAQDLLLFFFQSQNTRASQIYSDIDQFKFRWLIPLSALQVRMGNAAGNCVILLN